MSVAFLALGSNLGDRQRNLDAAIARVHALPHARVVRVSPIYETAPVGGPADSGAYLNAVSKIETTLGPAELLAALLEIERMLGRVRSEQNAPRTIDLDVLLFDDLVRNGPDPIVPHPRLHERRFVLQPLVDLDPYVVHPILKKTVRDLLDSLPADPIPQRTNARDLNPCGKELTGLRALVTGSTKGIGFAIAHELARAGADVIVHGRRSQAWANKVAEEIREFGGKTGVVLGDLASDRACDRLVESAWDLWDGLDILVQNAGVDVVTGEASKWFFEKKLKALLDVDLRGTVQLCRSIGERMKESHGGTILTMGWDQAESGFDAESGLLFGTTKGAVMAFTRSLAKNLAPRVRVNCLAPGWIKTAWGETASEVWQNRVAAETPLKRWGLPEDVAAAARWLASPAAAFITGQIIRINGGVV